MDPTLHFGELLRTTRRKLNLTREQLAGRADCSVETIKKLESGERRPSPEMALALAQSLNTSADELHEFLALARRRTPLLGPTRSAPPGNLPWPMTPLVGRSGETARIVGQLNARDTRLLTLVGPPGVGKTRLSIAVARLAQEDFPDGIWFISLSPISQPEAIAGEIINTVDGVGSGEQEPLAVLSKHFSDGRVLLLLDNFEHVLSGSTLVSRLLQSTPRLKVLATSRVALDLYGEHQVTVHPFTTPPAGVDSPESLQLYDAVQLLLMRIRAHRPEFGLTAHNANPIAQICRLLDGIPLALELAAGALRTHSLSTLLDHFQRFDGSRLNLLTGSLRDVPMRQRTLRHAIGYSFSLLAPAEQQLLSFLSVFHTPFDRRLAWALIGGQTDAVDSTTPPPDFDQSFQNLLQHHLIQRTLAPVGDPIASSPHESATVSGEHNTEAERYFLLDTIREFAHEQLATRLSMPQSTPASGSRAENVPAPETERALVLRRHCQIHATLVGAMNPVHTGGDIRAGRAAVRARLPDCMAALEWAIAHAPRDPLLAFQLAAGLSHFWYLEIQWREGIQQLERILSLPIPPAYLAQAEYIRLLARVESGLAVLQVGVGDYETAHTRYLSALARARTIDDKSLQAWIHMQMSHRAELVGDFGQGIGHAQTSMALYRELDAEPYVALLLERLAIAAIETADYVAGRRYMDEGLAIFERRGHATGRFTLLNMAGMIDLAHGNAAAALDCFNRAYLGFEADQQQHGVAWTLRNLALGNLLSGNLPTAYTHLAQAVTLYRKMGSKDAMLMLLEAFAGLAAQMQETDTARALLCEAYAARQSLGLPLSPNCRDVYTHLLIDSAHRLPPTLRRYYTNTQNHSPSPAQATDLHSAADPDIPGKMRGSLGLNAAVDLALTRLAIIIPPPMNQMLGQ